MPRNIVTGFVLASIALLLIVPAAIGLLAPQRSTAIVVVDRQRDTPWGTSETWITWLLRHWNYDEVTVAETLPEDVERPEVVYLNELNHRGGKPGPVITRNEADRLYELAMTGTTIVAELSRRPGPIDTYVYRDIQRLLGIRSIGWMGRRVEDLGSSALVPEEIRAAYARQNGAPWSFAGPGVLFSHNDGRVVVLPERRYLNRGGVRLVSASGPDSYFAEWFSVVEPVAGTEVPAHFTLDLNAEGRARMDQAGIPARFPAMVRYDSGYHRSVVFTGDVSAFDAVPGPAWYAGIAAFRSVFTIPAPDAVDHAFWTVFAPTLSSILDAAPDGISEPVVTSTDNPAPRRQDSRRPAARVLSDRFQVYTGDEEDPWKDFRVQGINLGMALPGRRFTEFPRSDMVYLSWFRDIAQMGINTVRVYTLAPPVFYRALAAFNARRPDTPLRLLQEIWPEENPPGHDLLAPGYGSAFAHEIRYAVDAVHGNAVVPPRPGRASGTYRHNVSPYLLGFLVGREIEPIEVHTTNVLHSDARYQGRFFSSTEGNATEAWLAQAVDTVAMHEADTYGVNHPVSIVSWPPLDPLDHPTEWAQWRPRNGAGADTSVTGDAETDTDASPDSPERRLPGPYNDAVSVDIDAIDIDAGFSAGFFGSYHIYPNYPDFIINDPRYAAYRDDEGELRYGGYLRRFMAQNRRYPALVAEFGIATGQGTAHFSPDGLHHGGLTESAQGHGVVRMFKAIHREGYLGGVIFAWMDEWVKKTWTTEPFMVPYERNVFWHNAVDPEQNYGVLAHEAVFPSLRPVEGLLMEDVTVKAGMDVSFLHLSIDTGTPLRRGERLLVGLDTYDPDLGTRRYDDAGLRPAPSGMEFLLTIAEPDGASLTAVRGYALGGVAYASPADPEAPFEPIRVLVNRAVVAADGTPAIQARYWQAGTLIHGSARTRGTQWYRSGTTYHVRLPWTLLNVSDPSDFRVLHHPETLKAFPVGQDVLESRRSNGILLSIRVAGSGDNPVAADATERIRPPSWSIPTYRTRKKESYEIIRTYLDDFSREYDDEDR